ncbi:basic-leucine zipper transcription factor A isoform X2 [Drosophila innubila]|uniref:basic-leucine zipper transcription factor A isoform X2 n=1 Tax=Drosophila innubila TaxID=198719 RepID=UPI00148D929E|nr:basic-leucine zipper transcription factor A isoform X2 [Drosophila innubila]
MILAMRSRTRAQQCPKMCYEDLITLQALREQNERSNLKAQGNAPVRSVEFRLPPLDKQRQFSMRQPGGSASSERELYRKQQQQHQQHQQQQHQQHQQQQQQQQTESASPTDMPSSGSESVRDLQDSCADFFNIIYENVLEAVNGAVEQTVEKHFQDILLKVNQLTSEMTVQKNMLKQINSELMAKISELNETNLNQFKFIAQMLIDSQTIHYRSLNQQRQLKQQNSNEQDHPKRSASSERPTGGCSRCQNANVNAKPQQQAQRPQHQLWQQQDANLLTYLQPSCKNCNTQKSSLKPDRTILRRTPKGISTASMPNLHQASFSSSTPINSNNKNKAQRPQRSPTPSNWSQFGTRRVVNQTTPPTSSNFKKCRCQCHSPAPSQNINYLLSNNCSLGRKLRTLSKTLPNMEDDRAHT